MSLSSQKRREIAIAVASFLVLLVTTVPVTSMMGAGWDAQGITFTLFHGIVDAIGTNIDLAVVIPVGILVGWLLLFLVDTTKRVQAPLVILSAPLFLGTLYVQGKWFTTVNWVGFSPFLIGALLIGVLTGSYRNVIRSPRYMLFPIAARSLYGLAAVACVVFFFDRLVFATPSPLQIGIDAVSSFAFVFVLNLFTQYEARRDVTIVSTDRRLETDLISGLFRSARELYGGLATESAESLNSAVQVSNELVSTPAGFRYKHPDRIFASSVTIRTRGFHLQDIEDNRDTIAERVSRESRIGPRVRRFFHDRFIDMFPTVLVTGIANVADRYPSPTERFLDSMIESDVVILAASYEDLLDDENQPTDTAELFGMVCSWYTDLPATDLLVVITDGQTAIDDYQDSEMRSVSLWDQGLSDYIRSEAEMLDCSTVRVTEKTENEPTQVEGSKEILLEI